MLTERWEGRWKEETFRILDETALDLKRSKCGGIRVESEQPHFIGLDDCEGTVLIFHLSKKVTTVGRDEGQHNVDIGNKFLNLLFLNFNLSIKPIQH